MKKKVVLTCEIKRYRQLSPALCSVCPRLEKCRAFRAWYHTNATQYLNFVLDICNKFPDKYSMEVSFMAEKKTFIQIVDIASGKIERVVSMTEIDAMSAEEKLALSRTKNLFIVTHKLEPIVKVEMKKTVIAHEMIFSVNHETEQKEEPIVEITPEPVNIPKAKKGKKTKSE